MLKLPTMPRTSTRQARKLHTGRGKYLPQTRGDFADLVMQGFALQQQGRLEEAQAVYRQVLKKDPRDFDALHMLGLIAAQTKNPSLAVRLIGEAIEVNPNFAPAHSNLGASLKALQRLDEAVACYERALALAPETAEAHSNLGNALRDLRRPTEALARYDLAIALKPDYADAYFNRGLALNDLKRHDEAMASFARAFQLNPGCDFLPGFLINAQHLICEWGSFDSNNQFLQAKLERGEKASTPFIACTTLDSPQLQKAAAEIWVAAKHPMQDTLGPLESSARKTRIRLGYFSADFYDHATTQLAAELFELHDRDRFELFAFSFGPPVNDAMQRRVASAFDHFIDIRHTTDLQAARMARELGIDIAIDLKGYTQDARAGIFSYRCAPVQVSYLGYPGTMGAQYIDYLIADEVLVPESARRHYTEKMVYMPHSYQVNDTKRVIADRTFTREELGLPEEGFVYCCFNNSYKITPRTFDGWMRILQSVEGSVLWLLEDNPHARRNLEREAAARGVDPGRLIFGRRMALPEHLARHRQADLFLDTLPCNAHTTASDALWAGLPVLTLAGQSFAGRVAASLLHAMDLPELVTQTPEAYERMAIELASAPEALRGVREKIAGRRESAPLYNPTLFTRHLENAYTQMQERQVRKLPPDHLFVKS